MWLKFLHEFFYNSKSKEDNCNSTHSYNKKSKLIFLLYIPPMLHQITWFYSLLILMVLLFAFDDIAIFLCTHFIYCHHKLNSYHSSIKQFSYGPIIINCWILSLTLQKISPHIWKIMIRENESMQNIFKSSAGES